MRFPLFILLVLLIPTFTCAQSLYHPDIEAYYDPALKPFYFGVASGDPRPEEVVLWTKVVPDKAVPQTVGWEISADTLFENTVQTGEVRAMPEKAFTVKITVKDLKPGTTYFYRFRHEDKFSPVGRTKTAPVGSPDQLRIGVVSCSDFQSGYFNAYGHLAKRNDIDLVVHLGDYIYEYGARKWGPKKQQRSMKRQHIPDHYLTSLQDYRTRYAQHRLDPQLRECHRLHPFVTIWDDHEISNDVHSEQAGIDWEQRESTARQVYFEWLPIADNPQRSIIRSFAFGDLAEMWMLDGRLEGRSAQAKGVNDPEWQSPERTMLGAEQTDWLLQGMEESKARWKILGNQVVFSPLHDSKVFDRRPKIKMDRWDGYPAERKRIFDFWYEKNIRDIVVITGDVHTAWAFDLTGEPLNKEKYDRRDGTGVIGAEFVTPSVTSFNFDELMPKFITWEAKRRLKRNKNNPHLRYTDLNRHGYMVLTLTAEEARADWYFMKRKDRVDLRVGKRKCYAFPSEGKRVRKK